MKHLIKTEWQKAMTLQRLLLALAVVFLIPTIQFLAVRTGYVFYRPIEVHTEAIGSVIALLFPLFFIILYANSYAVEQKENFITYTKTRVRLSHYLTAKGIVNAAVVFGTAFLMIFLPFVFIVYIEPAIGLVSYYTQIQGVVSVGTFEPFLRYGTLVYAIIYSLWVAVNAVLYATAAYVLTLLIKNSFLALSLPFLWYFVIDFAIAVLGYPQFSMTSTVFPFNIIQQPLWTVLVPFSVNLLLLSALVIYTKTRFEKAVYEYAE
ncbi:ABC transporter permease [Planococcus sp. CAU13]|uniref:ABC transporter permease n=1 Tax=Planococcus sp. CAU13 TaxID=1541197 RepID=UPI00052FF0D6|nr:ABC transporter permease [Planococcus sp. CAU13]